MLNASNGQLSFDIGEGRNDVNAYSFDNVFDSRSETGASQEDIYNKIGKKVS